MNAIRRFRPDAFLMLLMAVILLASVLPVRGAAAEWFAELTTAAITLLFFLHGAKLSRAAILAGIGAWRLHLMVLAMTFAVFPLLAVGLNAALGPLIAPEIAMGLVFLAIVPSTVQSSIAMTSIAGGNVPAAICTASLSNVLGILLTPALAGLLIHGAGEQHGSLVAAVVKVTTTLLLPFILGHLARPWIGAFIDRHRALVMRTDRSAILLVVYTAFSAAVVDGLWRTVAPADMGLILLLCCILLGIVLLLTRTLARVLAMPQEDEAVLVFCGSKKSLVSGVPLAGALFPPAQVGLIILPLMLFHQVQLIVCAAVAQNYARRKAAAERAYAGASQPL